MMIIHLITISNTTGSNENISHATKTRRRGADEREKVAGDGEEMGAGGGGGKTNSLYRTGYEKHSSAVARSIPPRSGTDLP